jgi:hypothetical protein
MVTQNLKIVFFGTPDRTRATCIVIGMIAIWAMFFPENAAALVNNLMNFIIGVTTPIIVLVVVIAIVKGNRRNNRHP